MAKGKKLTAEEKEILENLKSFTKKQITWTGGEKGRDLETYLREVIQDNGNYAVFYTNKEVKRGSNSFDNVIVAPTLSEAEAVMRFNPSTHSLLINAKYMSFIKEEYRAHRPRFGDLNEENKSK